MECNFQISIYKIAYILKKDVLEFPLFCNDFGNFNKLQRNFNQNGLKIYNSLQRWHLLLTISNTLSPNGQTSVSLLFASIQ